MSALEVTRRYERDTEDEWHFTVYDRAANLAYDCSVDCHLARYVSNSPVDWAKNRARDMARYAFARVDRSLRAPRELGEE